MPKVRMQDGSVIDVATDALLNDDGVSPFVTTPVTPPEQTFTAADIEAARQQEKDKLYSKIDATTTELTALREQVGSLTAAEQRREAELEAEQARLAAEKQRQEEEGLSAQELIARQREEWQQSLAAEREDWNSKFAQEQARREAAEAVNAKEREFSALGEYTRAAIKANEDNITPELLPWIQGNTKEEIDAAVKRAVDTTAQIGQQFAAALQGGDPNLQQPVPVVNEQGQLVVPAAQQPQPPAAPQPPATPGTRVTGPGTDPSSTFQQLSADDIRNMDMSQYAKLRPQIGIGGQSSNRGMFG